MTLGGDFGNDFLDMPALAMNQKSPSTTSPLSWSDMHGFGLDPSFSNPQMTTDYAASSDMWVSFPELGDAPSVTQVGSSTAPSVAVGGSAVSPPLSTTTLPQGTDAQSQVADANNPAAAFSLQSLLDVVHMLEKQMARSSIGLEEAMQATKVCMNIVAIALESEEMRRCSSCPNLIFMGLQMCIDLYEKALAGLREHGLFVQQDVSTKQWQWLSNISDEMMVDPEQHQQLQHQPSSSPVPQHLLARFRYGNYVFDLKDQIALGNHIIRRDVRHCIQVGHAVADRWLGHVQGRSSSQSSLNFQKAWHLEIERRATALIESLPVD